MLWLLVLLGCHRAATPGKPVDDSAQSAVDSAEPDTAPPVLCPGPPPVARPQDVVLHAEGEPLTKVAGLFALGTVDCAGPECTVDLQGTLKVKRSDERPRIVRVTANSLLDWDVEEHCGVGINEVGTFDNGTLGTASLWPTPTGLTQWYRADDVDETQVIARSTSTDGCTWAVDGTPVVSPTEPWADKAVIAPHVIAVGDELWMYYRGSRYGNQGLSDIGLQTSVDGITWTPHPDNPVFRRSDAGWDASLLADPHVWVHQDRFLMVYSGHDRPFTPEQTFDEVGIGKQLGIAASWDGVHWEACSTAPVLVDGVKSDNAFVIDNGDGVFVYYRQTARADGRGGILRMVHWPGWPGDLTR